MYNQDGKNNVWSVISDDHKKILKLQKKKISCPHKGCVSLFKTNKLKILHHNSNDPECSDEKFEILEMIKNLREYLSDFCFTNKIESNVFGEWEEYKTLKNNLLEFKTIYADKEKLISLFSESLAELGQI
jgi:hypothetical protein